MLQNILFQINAALLNALFIKEYRFFKSRFPQIY